MTPEERRARLVASLIASGRVPRLASPENLPRNPTEMAVETASHGIDWGNTGPVPGPRQPSQTPITDAVVRPGSPAREAVGSTERALRTVAREATGMPAADRALEDAAYGRPLEAAGNAAVAGLTVAPWTRLGQAMFSTPSRAIGTGLGMGVAAETAEGRGPIAAMVSPAEAAEPSDAIRELQEQLRDAGYYTGPIDGVMSPDGPTAKAKEAFDADQAAQQQQQLEAERIQAEAAKAKAEAAKAAADTAETERKRQAAEAEAAQREKGEKRLQEIGDRWSTKALDLVSSLGPYAGYAAGGYLGNRLQRSMIGRGERAAEVAAQRADEVMGQRVASNNVPGRIGRLNRFWSEGNPGRTEPFMLAPRRQGAHPYAANPAAPPASELYQPTPAGRAAQALPVPAMGLADYGIAEYGFSQPYRAEVKEAQEALDRDPSEANIQRLQLARLKLAVADVFGRVGLGAAAVGAGTELHHMRGAAHARPGSLPLAEQERGRLTRLLTRPPKKKAAGAARKKKRP